MRSASKTEQHSAPKQLQIAQFRADPIERTPFWLCLFMYSAPSSTRGPAVPRDLQNLEASVSWTSTKAKERVKLYIYHTAKQDAKSAKPETGSQLQVKKEKEELLDFRLLGKK